MKHFSHILCVMSPDQDNGPLLKRALTLAENNQARLTCVEVIAEVPAGVRPPGASAADATARLQAERLAALEAFTADCRGRAAVACEVLVGLPYLEVVRAVLQEGYDLVLKEAEDPGFLPRLFGSDDVQLLRKCPCPVWLTKPGGSDNYRVVLAAVDLDLEGAPTGLAGLNRRILSLAGSLTLSDFAALHVLHVWDAPGEGLVRAWSDAPDLAAPRYVEGERQHHQLGMELVQRELAEILGQEAMGYLGPRLHLVQGAAAEVIPATAARLGADLVVMGTLGRTGIAGVVIGNTAEAVFEQLQCAVLAVKPAGFVSPLGPGTGSGA